ncbi:hypothetical protein OG799_13845 [Micromonospora sp. NBC_00898]|uniref:hypothetical protein n=1 Tax=Micromonospora sp. NBC_00898 TaxID=2975981 RepID=UPI003867A2E6|nr:hypothetical protein OG799_13845 [Micromonospora sp. NBC_00898]
MPNRSETLVITPALLRDWAHAVSGQRLVPRYGRIGFLARELLDEIPHTLATV